MDAAMTTGTRQGYRMRCLRDLWVEVAVDLDRDGPVEVVTDDDGLSEAIARIAAAGGFALRLACEGGPSADPERMVEDCALELGAALGEALGPGAAGVEFTGAAEGGPLPQGFAAAFIESFGRALGARITAVACQHGTAPGAADCFAGLGIAIREARRRA